MIQLILGLFWGAVFGYCLCMIKVNRLKRELNSIKIDKLHE